MDEETANESIRQLARMEQRMDHVCEKMELAATHQEKMWSRIDQVVQSLIELKAMFASQATEVKSIKEVEDKVDLLSDRILILETQKKSVWDVVKPVVYSVLTGVGTIILAKMSGFLQLPKGP